MKSICENSVYFAKRVHLNPTKCNPVVLRSPHGHLHMSTMHKFQWLLNQSCLKFIHNKSHGSRQYPWGVRASLEFWLMQANTNCCCSEKAYPTYGKELWFSVLRPGKKGHILSLLSQHSSLHSKIHWVQNPHRPHFLMWSQISEYVCSQAQRKCRQENPT